MKKRKSNKGIFKLAALFLFFISMVAFSKSLLTTNAPIKANESSVSATKRNTRTNKMKLSKTATPVDGVVNQWDVTLRVEAEKVDPVPGADVVLLVDISLSMDKVADDGESRMKKARDAAQSFVDQLLSDGSDHKVALVDFNGNVHNHTFTTGNWASSANKWELDAAIASLDTDDTDFITQGTFTQAGIREATKVLETATSTSRNIVLISDGAPTYSYLPKSPYNSPSGMEPLDHPSADNPAFQTVETIPESGFDYNAKLTGSGMYYLMKVAAKDRFDIAADDPNNYYVNSAHSAIAEATISKSKEKDPGEKLVTDIYTVGFALDKHYDAPEIAMAKDVMKKVATSEDKCYDATPENLKEILDTIAKDFTGNVKAAEITDPMGKGFVIDGTVTNANASQGKIDVSGSPGSQTIKWNIGAMSNPVNTDPDEKVMYAELTYRVSATNDVLTALDGSGLAFTNGDTVLKYTDAYDNENEDNFNVPKVKPIIVKVKKELYDEKGNPITGSDEKFDVEYGNDKYTADDKFKIKAGDDYLKTVHPWVSDKEYSVQEILDPSQEYTTEIVVNGKTPISGTSATFKFDKDVDKYEHQEIVIKNKKIAKVKTIRFNIRQVVVNPLEDLVVPSKGFYRASLDSSGATLNLTSGSTTKNTAAEVNQALFTTYQLETENDTAKLTIDDLVPEYYEILGYVLTKDAAELNSHVSTDAKFEAGNGAELLYDTETEYWLSMFIQPKMGTDEQSPRPYSWDYETNKFE